MSVHTWLGLASGVCITVACSAEQISRGEAYNDKLRACSLAGRAHEDPQYRPPEEVTCPALSRELLTMPPFRSRFWLQEVGPPSHDVFIDYLCVTPHFTPATVKGGEVLVPSHRSEDRGSGAVPTAVPPPEIERAARDKLLRVVPNAKDIRIVHRRVHRPLVVREFMRVGPAEVIDVRAGWDATADLDSIEQRASSAIPTRTNRPTFATCEGHWFAAESSLHTEPAPMLPHALERRSRVPHQGSIYATAGLAEDFEAALLKAAREGGPSVAPEREPGSPLLPPREQHVDLVMLLYPGPGPRGLERVAFRAETSALVFSGFEADKRVTLLDHDATVRVTVTPEPPPPKHLSEVAATVSLAMIVHLEIRGEAILRERFTVTLPVAIDHGRAMTAGMESRTHKVLGGERWRRVDGSDRVTATIAPGDPPVTVEVRTTPLQPFSGVERD